MKKYLKLLYKSIFSFSKKEETMENETVEKHKSGVEFEYLILDRRGMIANVAPLLIAKVKEKYPDISIVPEAGQNVIEVVSAPENSIPELLNKVVSDLEKITSIAESLGFLIYPFGTYPGEYTPLLSENKRYKIQEKIFGKERNDNEIRCVGVHTHFTLPWGVFDQENKTIKNTTTESKYKEAMINTFNFYTAADPALTTFAQSSPFFQGKHLAKDSRMVILRSGALKPSDDFITNTLEHGSLHPYIITNTDMIHAIKNRFDNWLEILKKMKIKKKDFFKSKSILATTWSPVRINPHGTTESRSMDSNFPSIIFALALIMRFVSKKIQEDFIKVKISDSAIETPFIIKNGELLIPPDSYVINKLQVKSAYKGLESEKIYNYCSAFLKLGEDLIPPNRQHFLDPLRKIITERKTVSDIFIEKAQELGWEKGQELSPEIAGKLAISAHNDFIADFFTCKMAKFEYYDLVKKQTKK